jgi:hypothetical protein
MRLVRKLNRYGNSIHKNNLQITALVQPLDSRDPELDEAHVLIVLLHLQRRLPDVVILNWLMNLLELLNDDLLLGLLDWLLLAIH